VVWLKVAMKLADMKLSELGNCRARSGLPSESSNWPGPMSPKGMTCGGLPSGFAVRVAFIRVNVVDAGKSGGRSNAPVKSEMLNVFTPGVPFAGGAKMSKERTPIGIVLARAVADIRRAKQIDTGIDRFISTSLYSSGPGLSRIREDSKLLSTVRS